MGFESQFTLYRKYSTKISKEEMSKIVSKYVADSKSKDYGNSQKPESEYAKEIPLVLDPMFGERSSTWDEQTQSWVDKRDHSANGKRKNLHYVLAEDGSDLDELLYWHFISDFNCIADEFGLGHKWFQNEVIIDKHTAEMMLQACKYLLNGRYSDEFEEILGNKWIDILANGNSSDSYWPYTYRNNVNALLEIPESERENLKYTLVNTKKALEAYLDAGICGDYDDGNELLLVYSISY